MNTFRRSLKTADNSLLDLATELVHLTNFLRAVQTSLKGQRAYDLSHFDDSLWQQSEIALSTCQTTLNELSLVVKEIRIGAGRTVIGRRVRLANTLNSKAAELQSLRDRIAKSNLALQTILQTITVSLSLRNNASQGLILQGLDDLKASIDRVMSRSWQNAKEAKGRTHESSVYLYADAQMNRNLRDLAQAARQFHSAASSTAGSAANSARSDDEGSSAPWQSYPGADVSLFGDFSDDLRERVEEYVRDAPAAMAIEEPRKRSQTVPSRGTKPLRNLAVPVEDVEEDEEEDESDEDDDAEFELAFVKGLQELISYHLRAGHYTKAVQFINQAMSNSAVLSSDTLLRTLQCQLALAHLLQGQWRLASSLLTTTLARLKKDRDAVVCSLLHGLAVAHLTEYAFEDALEVCKMALYGRRRLHKRGELDVSQVNDTVGLFATIYDMTGDFVRAEVLRGQLPSNFTCKHPESAISFLLQEESLRSLNKGDMAMPDNNSTSIVPGFVEMPDRDDNAPPRLFPQASDIALVSPLRTRICEHERLENDTAKEVVFLDQASPSDADDEASPITEEDDPVPEPLHRRLTQILRGGRPRRPNTKLSTFEEEAADDSGYGTSSPVEDAVPSSPWRLLDFSALRRNKTKRLIKRQRKQPAKKEKEVFKLLSMESRSKVEGPGANLETLSTDVEYSTNEESQDMPETGFGASLHLAELDATPQGQASTLEDRAADSSESAEHASRYVDWVNAATAADEEIDIARSPSQTRATLPSKLKIPYSMMPRKQAPLSIPSLDPRNLTHEPLSPRLTDTISSVSHCLAAIPQLKVSEDMDAIWTRLHFALEVLKTLGADRCLERDVEAAMGRLERRSRRLRKPQIEESVEGQKGKVAVDEGVVDSSDETLGATDEEQQDSPSTAATETTDSPILPTTKAVDSSPDVTTAQETSQSPPTAPDRLQGSKENPATSPARSLHDSEECEDYFDERLDVGQTFDDLRQRMLRSRKFSFEREVEDMVALRKRWQRGGLE